jgi:Fe-S-cluster containining protein
MDNKIRAHFSKYRLIVEEINDITEKMHQIHSGHMTCKNGCDSCCIDFSIFPVEFYFILNHLKNKKTEFGKHHDKNTCKFLKNHSCTIYPFRPIMCRTHGSPLVYSNEEGEPELSVCHLNFTQFDFGEFTMENTIPQDKYNSKLFMLNKDFIKDYHLKKYGEFDLIPLKNLAKAMNEESF